MPHIPRKWPDDPFCLCWPEHDGFSQHILSYLVPADSSLWRTTLRAPLYLRLIPRTGQELGVHDLGDNYPWIQVSVGSACDNPKSECLLQLCPSASLLLRALTSSQSSFSSPKVQVGFTENSKHQAGWSGAGGGGEGEDHLTLDTSPPFPQLPLLPSSLQEIVCFWNQENGGLSLWNERFPAHTSINA